MPAISRGLQISTRPLRSQRRSNSVEALRALGNKASITADLRDLISAHELYEQVVEVSERLGISGYASWCKMELAFLDFLAVGRGLPRRRVVSCRRRRSALPGDDRASGTGGDHVRARRDRARGRRVAARGRVRPDRQGSAEPL